MRFLARFASAVDLECFRVDELRVVCGMLGLKNVHIEGFSSAEDTEKGFLHDALILNPATAAATLQSEKERKEHQPLGNHKNFYCGSGVGPESAPRQPLNFVIVHFDTIADAVAVASRCVLLKGISLLFATALTIDELIQQVQLRLASEAADEDGHEVQSNPKNVFVNPIETKTQDAKKATAAATKEIQITTSNKGEALLAPLLDKKFSFKYEIETVCWTIQGAEKLSMIQQFAAIPHLGQVQLSRPDIVFEVAMLYEHLNNPKQAGKVPQVLGTAFGVPIAISARTYILERYALNRRPYIGTTSMPPELTFLMANLAQVKAGDTCYDPFCGTGSSLVTCAHHGAIAYGSDIDGQAMRGGSVKFKQSKQILQQQRLAMKHYLPQCLKSNGGVIDDEEADHPTVLTNFKIYGLQPPERLRFDFSLWGSLYDQMDSAYTIKEDNNNNATPVGTKRTRDQSTPFLFDAILSDPPYGIREQKLQTTTADGSPTSDQQQETSAKALGGVEVETVVNAGSSSSPTTIPHTPTTTGREDYDISTMIVDLVRFAGVHLAVGRRMVFWHPTTYHYTPNELPKHPYLRIVLARPQMLSLKFVRVLVVMERVAEPWYPLPEGVAGPADVTKEVLFPNQITASLRQLMDTTQLDDNEAYSQYRDRREQKREAAHSYWRRQEDGTAPHYHTSHAHAHSRPSHKGKPNESNTDLNPTGISKRALARQKAQLNVDNREKKLAAAAEGLNKEQ